ncbi:MAG: hypothetical protein ACT6RN_26250 [Agrobacterium sp.]|uniref:hypothetical protein n=1 Tax=Rhizobium/Agrobacterium group TaxID=227290 RepID=UPI000EDAC890|nr:MULTISPECIES: hypothetical protein [Rhizobium/Agrobacterium group]MCA2375217.1 hypothetical protein [Agrobacterium tomkonis RTP8]HCD84548.1 hypothetical protein [Agrobacterium sp.]NTE57861.1 hypothetical protein [Agrobacterium tumefaciens]NTE74671.1 hypothetical protein [Agrobacterium tumefaciens]NTF00361.1 hypothetical protein [Agrobacterium tumefaciens]
MPLLLNPDSTPECIFAEWSINEKQRGVLVEIIAYLYLRQEENAQRVIRSLEPNLRAPKGRVADNVVRKLTAPHQKDIDLAQTGSGLEKEAAKKRIETSIIHRDGLLFQHISWVVARIAIPNGYMTSPHVRQADKGFDGFIIELDEAKGEIKRILLCEDKASITPRKLISSSVWPEIKAIRRGDRDDEILADLVTLLKSVPDIDAEAAVDEVFWEEVREYRVAVATGENRRKAGSFLHIVAGFEVAAGGSLKTRTAGVLPFQDVRKGLALLAEEVAAKVKEIARV